MKLTRFVKPYRVQFILGSIAKLAEAILELFLPMLIATILDIGIPSGDRQYIIAQGGKMFFLAILGFICATICQYYASVTSQGTGTSIRNALMEKATHFSYSDLDRFGTSSLINRITTDVNNYQQAVAMTMRLVTRAPFIGIGSVILSYRINPQLSLIFIILIPILGLVLFFFMRTTAPLYQKAQKKLDTFALHVRQYLSGIRVIRAFSTDKQESENAKEVANEVSDANIHVGSISAWMQPVSSVVINIGIILVLYFGASFVFRGVVSQGNILTLTTYATKILYAVVVTANLMVLFTKATASSRRIVEVLEMPDTPLPSSPVTERPHTTNTEQYLMFDHLSFHYGEGDLVLNDVTFQVAKGSTLGIVGVTGSGKTTLMNILQNFYTPSSGNVTIDGIPPDQYDNGLLRQIIGVVPQKNVLFTGTIAHNMRIGNQTATDEEIIQALKTAQCWDFVKGLEGNIEAPIFEGGKNFSGGQKQRLAIARALVKKPDILILDDSLSALDYKTDLALRQALAHDLQNLTTIIVSQRISSVVKADSILVLDHGEVVGWDIHEKLLQTCPTYFNIYKTQTDLEEEGA